MPYKGEERRQAPWCQAHEGMMVNDSELKEAIIEMKTNTTWIVNCLKYALGVTGSVLVLVVLPFSLYLVKTDQDTAKRIDSCEQRVAVIEQRVGIKPPPGYGR